MNPEDVGKILDQLGQKIGPYGQAAWEILVKQQVVEGTIYTVFNVIGLVLLVALAIGGTVVFYRMYRSDYAAWAATGEAGYRYSSDKPNKMERLALYAMAAGLWACAMWFFLYCLASSLIQLINPEYAALKLLLNAISK